MSIIRFLLSGNLQPDWENICTKTTHEEDYTSHKGDINNNDNSTPSIYHVPGSPHLLPPALTTTLLHGGRCLHLEITIAMAKFLPVPGIVYSGSHLIPIKTHFISECW